MTRAGRHLPLRVFAALLGAALTAGGCARQAQELAASACQGAQGVLPSGTAPTRLVGSYRLVLIAGRGPATGASVNGTLRLGAHEGAVLGSATIALDSVGAHRHGDLDSADPMAPGVLALPQADMILLRFGSEANRRDVQAFEAPYMVLHVRQLTDAGFAGTWASGAERTDAEGHFCAVRDD